jgi:hypothetical protein
VRIQERAIPQRPRQRLTTPHQHPPRSSFLYASAVQACADFFSRFGVGRAHAPAPAAPSPSGTGPARWGARAPPDAARRRPAAAEAEWAGLDVEDMGPEALPPPKPSGRLIPARPWVYLIRVTQVTVESSFNVLLSGPWPGQLAVWPAALQG